MLNSLGTSVKEQFDWPLFVSVCTIAVLGVCNLYSATSVLGPRMSEVYITQIYWLTLGAAAAILIAAVDYRYIERYGWFAYGLGVVLLLLVFLLGREVRGSQRWIPIASFSLQPSELMKVFLIIALAKYLHNDPKTGGRTLLDLVVPTAILLLPLTLILIQPDLGTAAILGLIYVSIMLLTHLKLRSLIVLALAFVVSAPLTWRYLLQDYQRERLTAFIRPTEDILDTGWHAYQSTVAIGSGGLLGKGFLHGTQNQFRFLPDAQTDFPFSVWSEEQGFIGALLLILVYVFLVLWGLRIAATAKDRFGAVVAVGVSALIFWQTVINLAMTCGLMPVVGVTLPIFSYGGSSVLTVMLGIGLLMNVSMRRTSF